MVHWRFIRFMRLDNHYHVNVVMFCVMIFFFFWSVINHILHSGPMKFYHLLTILVCISPHTPEGAPDSVFLQTQPQGYMTPKCRDYISPWFCSHFYPHPNSSAFCHCALPVLETDYFESYVMGYFYLAFYQSGSCYSYQRFTPSQWCYLVSC